MKLLHPESLAANASKRKAHGWTLPQSIGLGAVNFTIVSTVVYAAVAFGGGWFYANLGELGAYLAWGCLFLIGSGLALHFLMLDRSLLGCYAAFTPAFMGYAAAWIILYFAMRSYRGEWLCSLAAPAISGLILAALFRNWDALISSVLALIIGHSAGYFLGSKLHDAIAGPGGMVAWGVAYGAGFGAGFGCAFYLMQSKARNILRQRSTDPVTAV